VIDGDEASELVATLGVRGFPTFIGMRNGEIVARQAGFGGKRGLEALAQQLLEP
jgi:protein-disulfide isomerase-like protein with CxxC motif